MAWEPSALGPLVSTFDEPTLGFFKFPGSPLLPEVFPMGFLTPLSIDSSDDDDEDSENDELQQKTKAKTQLHASPSSSVSSSSDSCPSFVAGLTGGWSKI